MPGALRIVAGEFGGRRLTSPGEGVRPTTERVREAVFSTLGDIAGLRVVDLFCGSGALGLEAISRGAESAVLVDLDTGAAERNVEALGLGERVTVVRSSVDDFLTRHEGGEFDLAFADPPYTLAPDLVKALESASIARVMAPAARLVVETRAGESPLSLPTVFDRDYSGTAIRIYGVER